MSMTAKTNLAELRSLIAPRKKNVLPCSAHASGFPRGAVSELSGPHGGGKTQLALKLIAENPRLHVAWVESELSIYPCALPQQGVALGRVLFAEAGEQALWSAHQMLRSGIFGILVLSPQRPLEQIDLRRLQLAAEQSNTSVVLLSEEPTLTGAWPIALQLEVNRSSIRRIK
ncbi:MAG: hypothetical protein HY075_13345 [Deltaproteobacteria bacterium]|nr:hypothetical protein [Deltaproteobacteria bacterium]